MGCLGPFFSYISYHEDLLSVSKSRASTMSFLYVHKIRRKTEWLKSPLLNWILFSAPLSVVVSKLRMCFLVSIKAIHQGSAFNSTWMTEHFFHLKGHGAKPVAWCLKTSIPPLEMLGPNIQNVHPNQGLGFQRLYKLFNMVFYRQPWRRWDGPYVNQIRNQVSPLTNSFLFVFLKKK